MDIPYTKHTLGNGLAVLIHEDHRCPIVAVNLWYHVGSKNEQPGRTGFAHLFEHLMFEGSEHHDHGYFQPLQEAGAVLNGSTNADRTNYWEVVPPGALDLALWMESDRMGYLLPALTEEKFRNQRDVVLNERRQNYENRPYGLAAMAIVGGAVSAGSSLPLADDRRVRTISAPPGSTTCARSSRATTIRPTRRSRWPATSTRTRRSRWRTRYFGEIPPGLPVEPVIARDAGPRGETRLVLEDRSSCRASTCVAVAGHLRAGRRRTRPGGRRAGRRQDARGSTGAWSTSAASRPTWRPCSSRASSAASSRLVATAAPGHSLAELEAGR